MTKHGAAISEHWDTGVELAEAIRNEDLSVEFQPRVELSDGRVSGFEALARWRHREHGYIPPSVFIPAAECHGLILDLGRFVLREACRRVSEWNRQLPGKPDFYVSVNTSLHQIEAPHFVEEVLSVLEKSGIEPHSLVLEVTESCEPESVAVAASALYRLRSAGVMVEIDDFGKGYACLASLRMFPASALKIDGEVVGGVVYDEKDYQIVRSVIDLAHVLDMDATGEFVESGEQLMRLRKMGCDQGQGYFFGRPIRSDEVLEFLGSEYASSSLDRAGRTYRAEVTLTDGETEKLP